jgi:integrase
MSDVGVPAASHPMWSNISITRFLGFGDNDVRVQDPSLMQTTGKDGKPRQWYIRPYMDRVMSDGSVKSVQDRVYLGLCSEVPKREALKRKTEAMAKINNRKYVVQCQIPFKTVLDEYQQKVVDRGDNLAASTKAKYNAHINKHIRPAFDGMGLSEVDTKAIDDLLAEKAVAGLSHATRTDLKNIISAIFTQARKWKYWTQENPAMDATVGKARPVREPKKLSDEDTLRLLSALPHDVNLMIQTALFCALRISEVLGLQWKHVDFARGCLMVRQRFYRGDIDEVKTKRAKRDVALGYLVDALARRYPGSGHEDEFVFNVETHVGQWKTPGVCRDDRDINQHFLRPAAKALGIYWNGFGFHAFRREAITRLAPEMGPLQTQRMAGHAHADMTQHYTLSDLPVQEKAVRRMQESLLGTPEGVKPS